MRKEIEFSEEINRPKVNLEFTIHDRLIRAALFCGKILWAKKANIDITHLEDLNRACTLRLCQCLQDPSLIPIPDNKKTKSFETADLLELVPRNVKDRCSTGVIKHHWDPQQVRSTVIRHFITADFVKNGLNIIESLMPITGPRNAVDKLLVQSLPGHKQAEKFTLGKVVVRRDIPSTLGPFEFAPGCEVRYPLRVVQTLGKLLAENVRFFSLFIPENSEGSQTAYQHCVRTNEGYFSEPFFQIDIAGLSQNQLACNNDIKLDQILRGRIFEFEPSIAMYGLIETLGGKGSLGIKFREHLDIIRNRHRMLIALLAPTFEKLTAMREEEFGKNDNETLISEEVKNISGFDALWGPKEFNDHLGKNEGECHFLLYVRPSDPISKLENPSLKISNPLLDDPNIRKVIRDRSITLNIDCPDWPPNDPKRLKDTKITLPLLDMAFGINTISDIVAESKFSGQAITETLLSWMATHDLTLLSRLRAKPMRGVFGGYGQKIINLLDASDIRWLESAINLRGPYVLQPEISPLIVTDTDTQRSFAVIDRAFFSMVNGAPEFIGGIRILIPTNSQEFKRGRLHGTNEMISVPIVN